MKKTLLGLALAAGLSIVAIPAISSFAEDKPAAGAAAEGAKAPEGFESLFNGKDLTGWKGREDLWKLEDGAITGDAKQDPGYNTFLVWQGGDVADFELHFKYRIHSGNSGVQYRSKVLDPAKFTVGGYQGDFEHGTTFSGILYDEGGIAGGRNIIAARGEKVTWPKEGEKKVEKLAMTTEELQKAIKQGDWNDYVIIAKGNHLTHKINGNTTAEVIDESDKALKSGVLAIQLHGGGPMKVQVKDIYLKKM